MPASCRVDKRRRIVFTDLCGVLTESEIIEQQQRLRDDPDFESDFAQLLDSRRIERVRITTEGIRELAERSPFGGEARRAIVVNADLAFGLARMYEGLRGHFGDVIDVFRDMSEARRWLGIDPD